MKLVMIMCVRDEADIIADNLNHHLENGVAQVIVQNDGSVDGTRDILSDMARTAPILIEDSEIQNFSQGLSMTRMAIQARENIGADWILPTDADEFWIPHDSDLPASIASETADGAGLLNCSRANLFAGWDAPEDAPWYERMIYRVAVPEPIPKNKHLFDVARTCPHFYCDLRGKVTMQAAGLTEIQQGYHDAAFEGDVTRRDSRISIYHAPVRTRAQFESKARNGGTSLVANKHLPETTSWHIRRWYWRYENLGFEAAIEDAIPSSERIEKDLSTGIVIKDTTLRDLLAKTSNAAKQPKFSIKRLFGWS